MNKNEVNAVSYNQLSDTDKEGFLLSVLQIFINLI